MGIPFHGFRFFRLDNQQDQPCYRLCIYGNLIFNENKYLGGTTFDTLLARGTQAVVHHGNAVGNNDTLVGTVLFTFFTLNTGCLAVLLQLGRKLSTVGAQSDGSLLSSRCHGEQALRTNLSTHATTGTVGIVYVG